MERPWMKIHNKNKLVTTLALGVATVFFFIGIFLLVHYRVSHQIESVLAHTVSLSKKQQAQQLETFINSLATDLSALSKYSLTRGSNEEHMQDFLDNNKAYVYYMSTQRVPVFQGCMELNGVVNIILV